MKKILLYLIVPLLLTANPFKTTLEDEISYLQEETFVVSASRVNENIKKSSASITVIDQEMISNMGANNIFDVLRTVSGIGVSQSNVYLDEITVRGIKTLFSEKVLILLDGHSLNVDIRNGGAVSGYKNLPLEFIQRIEIIKGPASALYGENAFIALINIITKKAKDIDGAVISTKLGTNNTKELNLLFSNEYKDFEVTANLNYKNTEGNSAYIQNDAIGNSGHSNPTVKSSFGYVSLRDKSGFYIKGNYNVIEDGSKYGISYALNDKDYSKRESYFVELGYKNKINDNYILHTRVYRDHHKVLNSWEIYPDGFPIPVYTDGMKASLGFNSVKLGLETLLTIKKENYTVVSGVSIEKQKIKDTWARANYDPIMNAPFDSMENLSDDALVVYNISGVDRGFWALYSELLYDVEDNFRVTLGLRYDKFDDFGAVINPRAGLAWEVNKQNNIKLMYGEAFKSPPAINNIDVEPEKIKTLELSLENTSINNLQTTLTLFKSEIEELIFLDSTITYINQGKITIEGFEADLKYRLYRGSYIVANYTYQTSINKLTDKDLEDISNHEAYLGLNYRIDRYFNIYTDAKYTGKQTRADGDLREEVKSSTISTVTILAKNLIAKSTIMKFSLYNILNESSYDSAIPFDYP